jgi:acetylornithine deacetylase/succinyl-diaminopimelate desuccinylase-like protein
MAYRLMPLHPKAPVELRTAPEEEIAQLTSLPEVQQAYDWLRTAEPKLQRWQMEIARIPAPPFGEAARSEWLAQRFRELGLDDIQIDEAGNVLGIHSGADRGETAGPYVALSAHIDTVFPPESPLEIRQEGSKLLGPGVSDNGAGVTAMLAMAAVLQATAIHPSQPLLFIGNVGEEGEGDLRGMRHIFSQEQWLDSIACNVILDGAGTDVIVAEALGSRRFEVTVRGPGGHSWSDYGIPNPIVTLARAIDSFSRANVPLSPKTSSNVGVIHGGTSVNSIPEFASMRVDIRSTSTDEIDRLERALRLALDQSMEVERESRRSTPSSLTAEVVKIGDRPSGELNADARILRVVRAVDQHLNNSAHVQRASTDANIPLSLGREAVALGGGGRGGGAHTLQEWFDCSGRDLGLRRILLTVLALAGVKE